MKRYGSDRRNNCDQVKMEKTNLKEKKHSTKLKIKQHEPHETQE